MQALEFMLLEVVRHFEREEGHWNRYNKRYWSHVLSFAFQPKNQSTVSLFRVNQVHLTGSLGLWVVYFKVCALCNFNQELLLSPAWSNLIRFCTANLSCVLFKYSTPWGRSAEHSTRKLVVSLRSLHHLQSMPKLRVFASSIFDALCF